jgi:N-formylglutamate amidohydrolase
MKNFRVIKIKNVPIICNIPHSSTRMPVEFARDFCLSKNELHHEALRMADLYSDELFRPLLKNLGGIIANFSRIVADVERFENDKDENMAKFGMGALYTKSSTGKTIRHLTTAAKNSCLNSLYRPYHRTLTRLVKQCLKKFGKCLILDCHTFPATPRPYESDKKPHRPDICLGSDGFHTTPQILKDLQQNFSDNFTVEINRPFAGTMVPLEYYGKNKNVQSIMIEVNRELYMNEKTFRKIRGFKKTSLMICEAITDQIIK